MSLNYGSNDSCFWIFKHFPIKSGEPLNWRRFAGSSRAAVEFLVY